MERNKIDIVGGSILVAFGVWAHFEARSVPRRMPVGIDSGAFPEVISALLVMAGLILLILSVPRIATAAPETSGKVSSWGWFIANLALVLAYMLAISRVGFVWATVPYLFLQLRLLGGFERSTLMNHGLIATLAGILIWLIFSKGFGLVLPVGSWR